jgi:hypothetical protein
MIGVERGRGSLALAPAGGGIRVRRGRGREGRGRGSTRITSIGTVSAAATANITLAAHSKLIEWCSVVSLLLQID